MNKSDSGLINNTLPCPAMDFRRGLYCTQPKSPPHRHVDSSGKVFGVAPPRPIRYERIKGKESDWALL